MTIWEKLLIVPRIIANGSRLWVNPPRKLKIQFDPPDYDALYERERQEIEEMIGESFTRVPKVHYEPMKQIRLKYWDYHRWQTAVVVINIETRHIDWDSSSSWLFCGESSNDYAIIEAFFTLPVCLPLAPILLAVNGVYLMLEHRRGMSRHAHALLQALKGQLDAETEALLVEAVKNDWILK